MDYGVDRPFNGKERCSSFFIKKDGAGVLQFILYPPLGCSIQLGEIELCDRNDEPKRCIPTSNWFSIQRHLSEGDRYIFAKRGARVRALVAGGMDPQALELVENAMKRGVEVEALGPIYGSAKAEFLASCDVLALPSRYRNEAEPLVLIEGQLAGCLVIATDIGTISQTVCAGNGHTWSEASFPSEAADLVERLARRPQDLRKVRRAISINAAERANKERQAWNELTAGLV